MRRFRASLGYGVLDQVFARVFDFATLWIVMRTLPEIDLASYGIATAMMFMFSLVMVVPEAALMRDKKVWTANNRLNQYLRGFLLFAELRIVSVACVTGVVAYFAGWQSPYFVACVLALINQFIQLAEITRLDFRVDLQQQQIFRAEIALKLFLLLLVGLMFQYPGLHIYLALMLSWASIGAIYWSWRLYRKHGVAINLDWGSLRYPWLALRDFSLWQHLSGVITYVIYNIDPWVLSWFHADFSTISVYTLTLKISALFFAIPMFLQSMVTILVVNCNTVAHKRQTFRKMFYGNAVISLFQFATFVIAGQWIGKVFRGESLNIELFYQLGLILCAGVFILNLVRPLIADLILHAPMRRLLTVAYLPSLLFALIAYPLLTSVYGSIGCAYASTLSYCVFAILLVWQSAQHGVARAALFGPPPSTVKNAS